MMAFLADWFGAAQGWLFERALQPALFGFELGQWSEQAFEGTEWFLAGACELAVLFVLLRPLEALMPVHKLSDPRARWNDFVYTAVHRLGLFSVAVFFTLDPLINRLAGALGLEGMHPSNLELLWPAAVGTIGPIASFFAYLVVIDFFQYWFHRAQHQINWWWGLHSLHHSQRDMNLWSDNRNHLLDDLLADLYLALIALAIGAQPGHFVLLVSLTRVLQSLQHANVRVHFGFVGERLLVSPRYHRMHHAIGIGHESNGSGTLGGCNFAILLPLWDILFGTANFQARFEPTGVRDQLPHPGADGVTMAGREYGRGFWQQQWLGLKRMIEYMKRKPD
jgi:sterol desaturase/sphingolipid hydroxylase (fatty acid hydroxylase superfamily)